MAKKLMWQCPYCGDYVDVSTKICPHCKKHRAEDSKTFFVDSEHSNFFHKILSIAKKVFDLSNPGKRLKWFAKVDFVCATIAGIICAFVLPYDRRGNFQFWTAAAYFIGGFLGGYITAVPIYAFGSMVEDTAEKKAILCRIEEQMKQVNQHSTDANAQ